MSDPTHSCMLSLAPLPPQQGSQFQDARLQSERMHSRLMAARGMMESWQADDAALISGVEQVSRLNSSLPECRGPRILRQRRPDLYLLAHPAILVRSTRS
jgi:hypothetical protein